MKKTMPLFLSILAMAITSHSYAEANPYLVEQTYKSISVDEPASNSWEKSIVYEIMPRSFKDSDNNGHGDFNGIVEKLDYLTDLGVNAIWLTPIFEAPSYHGYDFEDFYSVESDYGSMVDFDRLIAESHDRNIKVILDLVLNHVSVKHPWFIKSENREAGYEDYFIWRDSIPEGWGQPWGEKIDSTAVWHWNETRKQYYYAAFASSQPDLNLKNINVINELNNVTKFWLQKGVDGFRLDAIRYAVEEGPLPHQADTQTTIDFWTQFTEYAKSIKKDVLLVGEAWTRLDITGRYRNQGKGLNSAFDFDFGTYVAYVLNPALNKNDDGIKTPSKYQQHRDALWNNLQNRQAAAPINYFSVFLTNHDQNRIMHTLASNIQKAKIAASLLMTSPGALYLYYGEEIGMSQYKGVGSDIYRRAIMQWEDKEAAGFNTSGKVWLNDRELFPQNAEYAGWWSRYWQRLLSRGKTVAAQENNPQSLLNHYKRLINARNQSTPLQSPQEIRYYPVANQDVWVIENVADKKSVWTIINLNPFEKVNFTVPIELPGKHTDLLTKMAIHVQDSMELEPGQTFILE